MPGRRRFTRRGVRGFSAPHDFRSLAGRGEKTGPDPIEQPQIIEPTLGAVDWTACIDCILDQLSDRFEFSADEREFVGSIIQELIAVAMLRITMQITPMFAEQRNRDCWLDLADLTTKRWDVLWMERVIRASISERFRNAWASFAADMWR
ncbi:MAG TPA: hypothetical protein PK402_04290 [Tepidisphaeraceae bacterium]|nr:hypothetical protein [Tepidisphaeraceae bacterium]